MFLCDDDVCRRECSACNGTTTSRCNQACRFVPNDRVTVALLSVAITKPLALFVSQFVTKLSLVRYLRASNILCVQVYGLFVWLHIPEKKRIFTSDLPDVSASLSNLSQDELYAKACEAGIATSIISTKVVGSTNPRLALITLLREEVS